MDFKKHIAVNLQVVLDKLGFSGVGPILEHPKQVLHGDYSTNVALVAFARGKGKGERGKFKTPLDLAKEISSRFPLHALSFIASVEVAPPGFINFWLSKTTLVGELERALAEGEGYGGGEAKGKMLVDFSHPNIAKRFGVGHLRSTIIGWSIIKLYRFLGWEVIADNFLGDWGTQFGAIIAAIKSTGPVGSSSRPMSSAVSPAGTRRDPLRSRHPSTTSQFVGGLTVDDLEHLYVEFNQKAKDDPKLWEQARFWFKKLEDGDREAREIWQRVREISISEFKRIWDLLGVEFDYIHGESFFQDKMEVVIEDAQKAGIAEWDKGALIVPLAGFEAPLMLLKSDGATTYETRDLAAVRFWMKEFAPDFIVYEVGSDQDLHFRQFFKVAETLGYVKKGQLVHVKHGLYMLQSGKMRTRAGQTVKLELVLDEAIARAKKLGNGGVEGDGGEEVARDVGIGAVKYFDLSHHPSSDIIFDWEKMFALEGNSAPYLQYTHARCRSVLGKAKWEVRSAKLDGEVGGENRTSHFQNLASHVSLLTSELEFNPEELSVLRYFYRFPEVVEAAAYSFSPNLLCNFLFELAGRYNTFYARHRILEDGRGFRLALTEVVGNILKTGLGLLGIQAPERM